MKKTVADYPELVAQWHTTKNGELKPDNFSHKSNKKVWWNCPVANDHEWCVSVEDRTNGSGCPFCRKRGGRIRVSITNCLETLCPDVAKEWHPTKNENITPRMVTANSNKKFWWKCPVANDHEWEISPNKRVSMNSGCPCCAGQKVVHSNSLAFVRPEVAKQWHQTKNENITPEMVTVGCKKKVWWKCPKDGHEWLAAVCDRPKYGCPYCNESHGEKEVTRILKEKSIQFRPQHKFASCKYIKPLPFDFVVWYNKKLYLIEYQGQQHFHPVVFARSGKDSVEAFASLQHRDSIKANWAKERNIPFLAIPYWEKDIEKTIDNFLMN